MQPVIATKPLQIVGIDLIGPYPISQPHSFRYVLVMTDFFSKWIEVVPLRKASAEAVAQAFFINFITRYGIPRTVVSDNGPQFISNIFQNLCNDLQIQHNRTVPYRPQANQTERINRTLVQMIGAYIGENHKTWANYIHHFAFALRTAVQDSTQKTPAELFLGRRISSPLHTLIHAKTHETPETNKRVEQHIEEACRNLAKARAKQAKYYDARRTQIEYKAGEAVLLLTHPLSSASQNKVAKFYPKYSGPYTIHAVMDGNVILIDDDGRRRTVNIDQIKRYYSRNRSQSQPPTTSSSIIHQETSQTKTDSVEYDTWENSTSRTNTRQTHPISTSGPPSDSERDQAPSTQDPRQIPQQRKRAQQDSLQSHPKRHHKKSKPQQGQKRQISENLPTTKRKPKTLEHPKRPLSEPQTQPVLKAIRRQGDKRSRPSQTTAHPFKRWKTQENTDPNFRTNPTQDYPALNTRLGKYERRTHEDKELMLQCEKFRRSPTASVKGEEGSVRSQTLNEISLQIGPERRSHFKTLSFFLPKKPLLLKPAISSD